jgi:hypothetical protein
VVWPRQARVSTRVVAAPMFVVSRSPVIAAAFGLLATRAPVAVVRFRRTRASSVSRRDKPRRTDAGADATCWASPA